MECAPQKILVSLSASCYRLIPVCSFLFLAEIHRGQVIVTQYHWERSLRDVSQTELLCWIAFGNEPFSFAGKKRLKCEDTLFTGLRLSNRLL